MLSSVVEYIYNYAKQQPKKTAIISRAGNATYEELWKYSKSFASILSSNGIKKGDYVIVKASHSLDYAIALLGVELSGAVSIPVENNLQEDGIVEIVDRVYARAIISDTGISRENVLFYHYDEIKHMCENRNIDLKETIAIEFPKQDNEAEVLFTTGTTGKSKGVSLTHRAILTVIENVIVESRMKDDNVGFVPMPLNHVFGLRRFQANLVKGATVVIQNDLVPIKKFFKTIEENNVTSMSLVPSALSYIFTLSKDYLKKYKNQIRYIESSSAPLSSDNKKKLKEILPNTDLFNFYGCTESTAACVLEYSKYPDREYCVGKPCINSEIKLLDTEGKEITCSSSECGRVIIKSNANMTEYWHDTKETAQVLHDGYIYTNDMGFWNEEGFLCILGRMDDVINIGGNKVAPDELEEIINRLPEIIDCGCIGVPSKTAGNELKLYIVTEEDAETVKTKVVEYLSDQVEAYKIPTYIEKIDQIPRTYNGKIQRKKLREL